MNDTILNTRQARLLKILQENISLSRTKIANILTQKIPVSGITVLRDLNDLVDKGFVDRHRAGRATTYRLRENNPLLTYVDLSEYFAVRNTDRSIKVVFDREIFSYLDNLFNSEERLRWDAGATFLKRQRARLSSTIYKRELERFLIDLAWKSSQIEGNTYDVIETETLIKDKIRARGHTEEEATMILNHKRAFDFICKNEMSFKKPLTHFLITELHHQLTADLDVVRGLRDQPVRITGTRYIPPSGIKIHGLFDRLVKAINRTVYPPEKALIASSLIAYLQPFADGNKRTSRMLANALLFAHGYYPLSYQNMDVNEYRKAIILVYEQNNLYHMKRIFMEQLEFSIENYFI